MGPKLAPGNQIPKEGSDENSAVLGRKSTVADTLRRANAAAAKRGANPSGNNPKLIVPDQFKKPRTTVDDHEPFSESEVDAASLSEDSLKDLRTMIQSVPNMIQTSVIQVLQSSEYRQIMKEWFIEMLAEQPAVQSMSGHTDKEPEKVVISSIVFGNETKEWAVTSEQKRSIDAAKSPRERTRTMMLMLYRQDIAELRKLGKTTKACNDSSKTPRPPFPQLFTRWITDVTEQYDYMCQLAIRTQDTIALQHAKAAVAKSTGKDISQNLDYFRRDFREDGSFKGHAKKFENGTAASVSDSGSVTPTSDANDED